MLACVAVAILAAASAHAAEYKMHNCAANSGAPPYTVSTNTTSPQNPAGIFTFENDCVGQGGDPPGEASFLRISEHEPSGNAGYGAYLDVTFETPTGINFRSAGGYLREPNAFNDGWQARFGFNYMNGSPQLQLVQGAHLEGTGQGYWGTTPIFGSYLWPWAYPIDFYRWTFEMICANPSGCDRSNYNAVDLNGIAFTLRDWEDSHVSLTNTGSDLLAGRWVKGTQEVDWQSSDKGSGLRMERLRVDGAQPYELDYQKIGACDTSSTQTSGEFARTFSPCPTGGPYARSYSLDTASFADGEHHLSVCTQDYAQYQGLNNTGGETCDRRTIFTDNHAPGAPAGLQIETSNPNRYQSHFGARLSLPPDPGSPIAKVHYDVVDTAGNPVMPEKVLAGTNPTEIPEVSGPQSAGDYRLKVWLEDQVGFTGPAAEAPIPHDTTPPAAPQGLSVTAPATPRGSEGFDVRWHDIADGGSPIDAARYQVLSPTGSVLVPTKTVKGEGVQAIEDLETPSQAGAYELKLWLEDEEGNVGAPVTAPLAYECVRSDAAGGTTLTSGLGASEGGEEVLQQGEGSTLHGRVSGAGGGIAGAALCVFSRVITDQSREFLGLAMSGPGGGYQFAIPAGPSRELSVFYRSGHREVASRATVETIVHPTFGVLKKVVHDKHYARFSGEVPGPDNNQVVVVIQAKSGKGWRVFRRYRTREDGHFAMRYRFTRTTTPTPYVMRAQVRSQAGYPYLQGNSDPLVLHVVP